SEPLTVRRPDSLSEDRETLARRRLVVGGRKVFLGPRDAIVDVAAGEDSRAVRMPRKLAELELAGRELDDWSAADRLHAKKPPLGVRDPAAIRRDGRRR